MSYPVGFVDKAINLFATSGLYNGCYLASLESGSYVCVYFDDCLFLRSGEELSTVYVRYVATEDFLSYGGVICSCLSVVCKMKGGQPCRYNSLVCTKWNCKCHINLV